MTLIQSVTQYPNVYLVTHIDGSISFVPFDTRNTDHAYVQAWIAAGGHVTVQTE